MTTAEPQETIGPRLSQEEMHMPRRTTVVEAAVHADYIPHQPNAEISVYNGSATIISGSSTFAVQAEIKAVFSPSPKMLAFVSGASGPHGIFANPGSPEAELKLRFDATKETYPVFARHEHHGWDKQKGTEYGAEFQILDQEYQSSSAQFESVVFGLLNFPDFWWKTGPSTGDIGPIKAEFGDWVLTIEDAIDTKETRKESERARSYLVTHISELKRKDARPFSPSDWRSIFEFLYTVLGFLSGKRTGPILAEGRDEAGNTVWRDQLLPRVGHDRHHSHWFPRPYPTQIDALIHAAWSRWQDPDQREALQRAVEWYWEAVDREITIETRLILAQVCLELLSWVVMVEEVNRLSADGFKKLTASDRIALLANQLQASPSIPAHFAELSRTAGQKQWTTAPQALAETRNKLIHPERRGRAIVSAIDWEAKYEITEWSVWLVELSILWLLSYQGIYDSRVAAPNHGFPNVTWVDPTQTPAEGSARA